MPATTTVTRPAAGTRAEADALRAAILAAAGLPAGFSPRIREDGATATRDSLYERAMLARERDALDVLHRVLDDDAERRAHEASTGRDTGVGTLSRPLHVVLMNAFRTLNEIAADLAEARWRPRAVARAFVAEGRATHVGVLLALGAVVALVFLD